MVDETLRLAAEERSHFNLKTEDVAIQDIVVPVMNHFLLQYGDNATIVFENLLAHPIHVDREHFSWAIKNLVDNALKYGPADHKTVYIKAWREAAQWHISVKDNGPGIPQEYQRKLFERFYRVPSNTNVKGFGLGLYIVRRIIEGHGGTIQLNSEVGGGSEFKITMNLK
jgi:signal transduction histidine kinase